MGWQGSLDGLCGPYAIVNAYDLCGNEEDWLGQDIFNIACSAIDDWPKALWKPPHNKNLAAMHELQTREVAEAPRLRTRTNHPNSAFHGPAGEPRQCLPMGGDSGILPLVSTA